MSNPSYPLTRNAQTALKNAAHIAEQHQQPSVDSLALLLALLQLPNSQVLAILTSLRVKVENLAARVSATIKLEAKQTSAGLTGRHSGLNLDVETESILSESFIEMKDQSINSIDEHTLLLGMLRSPESKAGQILAQYGITAEQVRERAHAMKNMPIARNPIFALPKNERSDATWCQPDLHWFDSVYSRHGWVFVVRCGEQPEGIHVRLYCRRLGHLTLPA